MLRRSGAATTSQGERIASLQIQTSSRFCEIGAIDFEADKFFHAASFRGDGRVSDAEEWIEHRLDPGYAMQLDAPFDQLNGKRRRVRPLFLTALNCFIRDKPSVATTTQVAPPGMAPPRNVTFVLIGNPNREPIELGAAGFREMKNVFMAIVQKPLGTDWLEMTMRLEIALPIFNCDRFDPMNGVLQYKEVAQFHHELMGQHWAGWCRTNVEKKRSLAFHDPPYFCSPFSTPLQIRFSILLVGIFSVFDSEVIGRRSHDQIDGLVFEPRHSLNAVLLAEIEPGHR